MAMPREPRHLLVYVDSLNRETREIERATTPIGYIEQRAFEPIEQTAHIARDCFDIRSDQKLRLREIKPSELQKIFAQEGLAKKLNERDFAGIFERSGAQPGRWVKVQDGTSISTNEISTVKKPRQKRLFR